MSAILSAKYYQENKERLKIFLRRKKKKTTIWSRTIKKSNRR